MRLVEEEYEEEQAAAYSPPKMLPPPFAGAPSTESKVSVVHAVPMKPQEGLIQEKVPETGGGGGAGGAQQQGQQGEGQGAKKNE